MNNFMDMATRFTSNTVCIAVSFFGLVHIYNRLPQEIVDCACVSSFQRELILIARKKCEGGNPDWFFLFSGRAEYPLCIFA